MTIPHPVYPCTVPVAALNPLIDAHNAAIATVGAKGCVHVIENAYRRLSLHVVAWWPGLVVCDACRIAGVGSEYTTETDRVTCTFCERVKQIAVVPPPARDELILLALPLRNTYMWANACGRCSASWEWGPVPGRPDPPGHRPWQVTAPRRPASRSRLRE